MTKKLRMKGLYIDFDISETGSSIKVTDAWLKLERWIAKVVLKNG